MPTLTAPELPVLSGSLKQVEWATKIRSTTLPILQGAVAELVATIEQYAAAKSYKAPFVPLQISLLHDLFRAVCLAQDAAWWIDHQYDLGWMKHQDFTGEISHLVRGFHKIYTNDAVIRRDQVIGRFLDPADLLGMELRAARPQGR